MYLTITESQNRQFYDFHGTGAFFCTVSQAPHVILRLKDGMDTAEPSTNGTSASNLYRLSRLLGDDAYAHQALETVESFESEILQYPWLFTSFMPSIVAGARGLGGVKGVVITGEGDLVDKMNKQIALDPRGPLRTVARVDCGWGSLWLRQRNSLLNEFGLDIPGEGRILLCENGNCREEILSGEQIKEVQSVNNTTGQDVGSGGANASAKEAQTAPAATPTSSPLSGKDNAKPAT